MFCFKIQDHLCYVGPPVLCEIFVVDPYIELLSLSKAYSLPPFLYADYVEVTTEQKA